MKHSHFLSILLLAAFVACSSPKKEETNQPDVSSETAKSNNDTLSPELNGDFIKKYPNGIVQLKGYYQHGKKNGQWTSFFPDGKIQSEGFFKDGLRDGKTTVYYNDGHVYYEGAYKDGHETGTWTFYDQQGNKMNEKNFASN
ncbi:MAG TPA: hypothetical protein PKO16_07610 [Bacteroidia bacterium]|jgi:antitoxin component YwqK of YwqJK toxin-antitoxin module|nr:hypothetical protein [Bacteroidia bacterium]